MPFKSSDSNLGDRQFHEFFFIKSIQGERNKYIFFSFRIEFLLGPVALLALVLNHEFSLMEILWTFSIYLESVAILPQLFMVQKTGEAESITSHYLFALGSYRGLYILNWIYRYYFEGKHVWIFAEKYLVVYTQNNIISSLYLRRCSPEKFCAKQMVLKNVIRTNWGIQKSKVQNNIMCPLRDSS